ncbi:MAG: acyl-ACP thioesterase domain-containing protein [Desulfovibrionaceae bacterium]
MPNKSLERSFLVRVDECGQDGRASLSTLLNYCQESAWQHAESLGLGREKLLSDGVAWVMTRLRVQIVAYPEPGDLVTVYTWPSAKDRYVAYRDFVLSGPNGELGRCTTAWVHMDIHERRMVLLESCDSMMKNPLARALEFTTRAVPRLRGSDRSMKFVTRRADLDVNGHVNNTRYVDYALESVPGHVSSQVFLREMDVSFRHECMAHEKIESLSQENTEKNGWIHMLKRLSDDTELIRAVTFWSS